MAFVCAGFEGADLLVPGIGLRAGGAVILSGKGGEGKSLLSLGVFLAWAEGATPFGCAALKPERPLRILVFYLEDDPVVVQERLLRLLGGRRCAAPQNLVLFGRDEEVRLAGSSGNPDETALRRLQATLEVHGPVDVCALDPLAYAHDADENQAGEMLRWLRPLRECVRATGAATWLNHHAGWKENRGRGTTAIQAWADLELTITRRPARGREVTELDLVKCNFASRWVAPAALAFDPRTLSFQVCDGAATRCPPEDLAAWVRQDLAGEWRGKLTDFYAAAAQHFGCARRTAETAVKRAVTERDHGRAPGSRRGRRRRLSG